MLFGNRRVVDEELERIKLANLPPEKPEAEVAAIAGENNETLESTETAENAKVATVDENAAFAASIDEHIEQTEVKISAKDILAMIIAAFSIILPYAAIFIAVTILFVYFFFGR